jgi:hypothetical protein
MNTLRKLAAILLLPTVAIASAPALADTTPSSPGKDASSFTAEQLEQMVAPIALYPDSLLMQILMASTYPLEIVQAQRWREKNPALKEKALEEALKSQEWDPSVKSLCGFPDVLKRMSENLDWTQDLGDAFLGQQAAVTDAVQRMRGKAYEAGQLKTTSQQTVTQQPDKIIVIQPASPEVVYVPTYSCTVVYGSYWHYPYYYYPAYYYAPPGYGAMMFTAGFVWGAAMWGGCRWGWGHTHVHIDVHHYNNFNRNTNINVNVNKNTNINVNNKTAGWNHNPSHRRGVNYRNSTTARQYGGKGGTNRVSNSQARGYDRSAKASQPSTRASNKPAGSQPSTQNRGVSSGTRSASDGGSSAWSGSRNANMDRSASSRGASSRSSSRSRR